jgi:acetyl esterase/lipase
MAFAVDTAADHGGDPRQVTLAGYSAGGYDAVIHGFVADDPPLPVTDCVVAAEVDLPQAVVSGGGPFFVADAARAGLLPADAWASLTPEQIDAFDPYLALDLNPDLTVRLWVGEDDVGGNPERPFPIADSNREFHAALVESGLDTELVEVPGGHEVAVTEQDSFVETIVEAARAP